MTPLPDHTVVRAPSTPAPCVSVIVPAYKVRGTLREAVDSLLRQTWRDLEVLVVDDASPDGDTEVLAELDDPRLGIFRLHRNVGLAGARNAGLALARGEFIALLDGDDVSLPQRIERQLQAFDGRPQLGLVGCLVNRIDAQGRLVAKGKDDWRLPDEALKPLMLFTNPFPAVYMLRRSALPAHGFRAMYAEDYALAADVADKHEVSLVREALVDYRVSPGGIMRTQLHQVSRDALQTQRRLLQAVSPTLLQDLDTALMAALMHFGRQEPGALGHDRLIALQDWMLRLEHANQSSRRHPPQALRAAIARVWEVVLLHATKLERLCFGPRYAGELLGFHLVQGRPLLRLKAMAHGLRNSAALGHAIVTRRTQPAPLDVASAPNRSAPASPSPASPRPDRASASSPAVISPAASSPTAAATSVASAPSSAPTTPPGPVDACAGIPAALVTPAAVHPLGTNADVAASPKAADAVSTLKESS